MSMAEFFAPESRLSAGQSCGEGRFSGAPYSAMLLEGVRFMISQAMGYYLAGLCPLKLSENKIDVLFQNLFKYYLSL